MALPTPEQLQRLPPEYLAEDVSRPLLNTSIALIPILTFAFALYVASRFLVESASGIETWVLMPLGYLTCIGNCICAILMVKIGGTGRHVAYVLLSDPSVIVTNLKLLTSQEWLATFSIPLPKIAVLTLYLRIFQNKWCRDFTWLTGVVVVVNGVQFLIATSVICQPYAFKWDKTIRGGHCGDIMAVYTFASIPHIITDVSILLLPIPTLCKLQTSTSRKIGIMLTFAIGGCGIVTSVLRFVAYQTTHLMSDLTYHGAKVELWTIVEPSAYFVCACLLGLRPIVRYVYKGSIMSTLVHRLGLRSRKVANHAVTKSEDPRQSEDLVTLKNQPLSLNLSSTGSNRSSDFQLEEYSFEHTPSRLEAAIHTRPKV